MLKCDSRDRADVDAIMVLEDENAGLERILISWSYSKGVFVEENIWEFSLESEQNLRESWSLDVVSVQFFSKKSFDLIFCSCLFWNANKAWFLFEMRERSFVSYFSYVSMARHL